MGSYESSRSRKYKTSWSKSSRKRRYRFSNDDKSSDDLRQDNKKKQTRKRKFLEEDIKEYLAKKAQNKAMKAAKKLKSLALMSGYSNDSNPFGDSNLNEKYVWRKKIERDVAQGVPIDSFSVKAEKKRQRERMAEIEKVKKRREERGIEKAAHEEKMALLARERARSEFQEWKKKEEQFDFDQSKVRSEIRLREGRTKPIDILLTKSLAIDPYPWDDTEIFKGLTLKEIEQLHKDIKMHCDLDRATPTRIQYWEALSVVCDWELGEARKHLIPNDELLAEEERGLHSNIEADVKILLQGKTYGELEALQHQIECQMRSGEAKVVEFWEAILKRLPIFRAKACLKEIYQHRRRSDTSTNKEKDAPAFNPESSILDGDQTQEAKEVVELGSYSPQLLLHDDDDNIEEEAIDPAEDRVTLEKKRIAVLEERRRRKQEMDECDAAVFGSEDKYRPRKPKYFNRVHTGYEWNKYNQTHYDHDNPPPKMVQGYKFHIFYPDLVDKSKAPSYSIEKDGENIETCILRFQAGPPYQNIAFRIVNKEWESSPKKRL